MHGAMIPGCDSICDAYDDRAFTAKQKYWLKLTVHLNLQSKTSHTSSKKELSFSPVRRLDGWRGHSSAAISLRIAAVDTKVTADSSLSRRHTLTLKTRRWL